jgi:hypothetical protein
MKLIFPLFCTAACIGMNAVAAPLFPILGLEGGYYESTSADLKDGSGNAFKMRQVHAPSLSYVQPFQDGSMLMGSLSAVRTRYDFDAPELIPWREVEDYTAVLVGEKVLSPTWSLIGLGMLRSAYEKEASFSDGLGWVAAVGARYRVSEQLSYVMGGGYATELEGEGTFLPLFGVEWQMSPHWRLDGMMGVTLSYDCAADGRRIISAGMDYQLNDFRLKKDALSGLESAVRPSGSAFFVSYSHQFSENFSVILKASSSGEQTFETWSDDRKLSRFKAEGAWLYGIAFQVSI